MKQLKCFISIRQAILIGAAVGIATKNIAVGIIIIVMFSITSYIKSIRR